MNNYSSVLRNTSRYRFIFSVYFKLLLVSLTVFLSWFSGVSQASRDKQPQIVFVKQVSIISYSKHKTLQTNTVSTEPVRLVTGVQISHKKYTPPKITSSVTAVSSNTQKDNQGGAGSTTSSNPYFIALNAYRQKNGKAPLQWDSKLAQYAQERVDSYIKQGKLDFHAGFNDYIQNQDGFHKLGFYSLGENSGYGHTADPVSIIENSYANSSTHNSNQLNEKWSYVGIGVSGSATNFIFGGQKM